ncbi:hypothetical protein F4819DRAFT_498554 [Hypoxylon fuscum]|nr:hypothetical protein F4819DRAFT_498554 [Hypoxylon fuscum]
MAENSLSRRDFNVLEKIKDPEANPMAAVLIDPTLPKDPNYKDEPEVYERIAQKERDIVLAMQQAEKQLASRKSSTIDIVKEYHQCVSKLGDLISEHPNYASARNNRAQALRRLYGDAILLRQGGQSWTALVQAGSIERTKPATLLLEDLDTAINLLTPKSAFASVSPQAANTLSRAYTQRGAIYHRTAMKFDDRIDHQYEVQYPALVDLGARRETGWSENDFEEAASRDFAAGGRYGNEIAKGLAVNTNPTAKLCGAMVREAMKKEYGPAYSS